MRSLLYLLIGFGAMLLLGFLLLGSPQPPVVQADPAVSFNSYPSYRFEWLLIAICWATAFITRPLWLCMVLLLVVCVIGGLYTLMGGLVWNVWDSSMRPDFVHSRNLMWFGVWMLLSRALTVMLVVFRRRD